MKRRSMTHWGWIMFGMAAATLTTVAAPRVVAQQHEHYEGKTESSAGTTGDSKEAIKNVKRLQAKRVMTVQGDENWEDMTGFGKESAMAEMMTLMMVGGSGMEHMKMGPMKPGMKMTNRTMGGSMTEGLPLTVTLSPNPPVVGENTLDIQVMDANGKPLTGLKLAAAVNMTSMDMGLARPKFAEGKDGHYTTTVHFSMKGPWRVTLTGEKPGDKKAGAVRANLDFNVGGKEKWTMPAGSSAGGWKVTLNTPPDAVKMGKNPLEFTILDPLGKPVTGAKVTGEVSMTSMDMGTARPKAQEGKDGHYTTAVEFSMKGPWRVLLTVAPPKQKPFTRAFDFEVKK